MALLLIEAEAREQPLTAAAAERHGGASGSARAPLAAERGLVAGGKNPVNNSFTRLQGQIFGIHRDVHEAAPETARGSRPPAIFRSDATFHP